MLALLLVGLPLAGCSARWPSSRPRARLDGVWLVNDRPEPQEVRVTVTEPGGPVDPVFETSRRLGAVGDPGPNDGNVRLDVGIDEPGRYVVALSTRDDSEGPESTVDVTRAVDGDEDCVLVRFTLTRRSGVQPWTKSYRQCVEETTP